MVFFIKNMEKREHREPVFTASLLAPGWLNRPYEVLCLAAVYSTSGVAVTTTRQKSRQFSSVTVMT